MKAVLFLLIAFTPLCCAEDNFRIWTQQGTNRALLGKPIDKKSDNSKIQIQDKKGRRHWIKASTLIAKDQEFIKQWVVPVDHLSARVVGSGRGYKTVEITAKAGGRPMRVTSSPTIPGHGTDTKLLAKGETLVYKVKLYTKYKVVAMAGEADDNGLISYTEEVDKETHGRKTGL